MNLYIESSAVVSWFLGESRGPAIEALVARAKAIATSELTLVECDRAFIRGQTLGALTAPESDRVRKRLEELSRRWHVVALGPDIVSRARQPFPIEPIRTLDALHVAAALEIQLSIPQLSVLTLDDRLAKVAQAAGLNVLPD